MRLALVSVGFLALLALSILLAYKNKQLTNEAQEYKYQSELYRIKLDSINNSEKEYSERFMRLLAKYKK